MDIQDIVNCKNVRIRKIISLRPIMEQLGLNNIYSICSGLIKIETLHIEYVICSICSVSILVTQLIWWWSSPQCFRSSPSWWSPSWLLLFAVIENFCFSVTIGHSFPFYPEVKMIQSVIRPRTSETDWAVIYLASTLMVPAYG